MEKDKEPGAIKPAKPRPDYSAMVKEACTSYAYGLDKSNPGMARVAAVETAIKTMTAADPALQALEAESMKHKTGTVEGDTTINSYASAVSTKLKARCAAADVAALLRR